MLKNFNKRVENSFNSLKSHAPGLFQGESNVSPKTAIILGSGLSGVKDSIIGTEIPFSKIEEFPAPTVKGHS
jgi:purine nucleoside phosphorylase